MVFFRKNGQSGVTLIEGVIAVAILAIASMAGFYQMRHVNKFKAALARSQAVDVIELATRELLEQSDVIKTTVAKSSRSALKKMLCRSGLSSAQ